MQLRWSGTRLDASRRVASESSMTWFTAIVKWRIDRRTNPASADSRPKVRAGASSDPHGPRLLSTSSTRFLLDQLLCDFSRRGCVWGMGNPCVRMMSVVLMLSHINALLHLEIRWQAIAAADWSQGDNLHDYIPLSNYLARPLNTATG